MNYDPVLLDALAMTFVEAAVRELEMQNPTGTAGFHKNVPLAYEDWNNERLLQDTGPPQAAST